MKLYKLEITKKLISAKLQGKMKEILLNHNQSMINAINDIKEKQIDKLFDNYLDNLFSEQKDRNYWLNRYYN